ncbi:SMC family ATPase [Streptomyces sp. NPDC005078]|uniref:SMC family ATPase n=1 Tax=unclassified Streptomyces TaxID=2593676 RepID=UPI0033A5EF97
MRPLTLTFSGLRSYPGTCGPLDFTGKRLVGILGDTGAGKSTLLEAMTAALYGKCSWSEREVSDLIAEDCPSMTVDLVFSVDGQSWRVHRVFHSNTKPSQALLENLQTGTAIDNVRGVDRAIVRLLGLDYKSFMTAVLLPQGRFDTLLNATDSTRTSMLRSIFGVEELHTARQHADAGRSRIVGLIHQAELARRDLLNDPRGEAETAQREADKEGELADQLKGRLEVLRARQQEAIAAQTRIGELAAAGERLAERQGEDMGVSLAALQQAHHAYEQQQAEHEAAHTAAEERRTAHAELLAAAKAEGNTLSSLAAACSLLQALPQQLSDLSGEQDRLSDDRRQLTGQDQALADAETALQVQQSDIDRLDRAAQQARNRSDKARQASDQLQEAVRTVMSQAATAARHLHQAQAEQSDHERLLGEARELTAALDGHQVQRSEAEQAVAALQRNDAAHAAGENLAGGDACPVCSHTLPDTYAPPPPSAPDALAAARRTLDEKAAALTAALAQLEGVTIAARQATAAHQKQLDLAHEHRGLLDAALDQVRDSAQELALHAEHTAPDVFSRELADPVGSAARRLAADPSPAQNHRPPAAVSEAKEAARLQEQHAMQSWSTANGEAMRATTELKAARNALGTQRGALVASRKRLEQAEQRVTGMRKALLGQLQRLPAVALKDLPDLDVLPTAGDARAAAEAVTEELRRLEGLAAAQDRADNELRGLAKQDKERERRREEAVTKPLRALTSKLLRWSEAAGHAAEQVALGGKPALPDAVDWTDPAATRSYASALTQVSGTLRTLLVAATAAAQQVVTGFEREIAEETIFAPGAPQAVDLLSPALLDPLSQRAGAARTAADQARERQRLAQSQIAHADQLDTALDAGRQQYSAWDGVCKHLTDAKFPAYLTELRTRSLLGVGSTLLDELSAGRLGFAENFRIVNRRSGIARSPKTLSGGETFQASLALSLALVELHSRSSTHIESLFLDEGFGTLDTAALDSALSVLRTHVGNDKLLAVISHLHPVAETVDDVLWVEKQALGSRARWLTTQERDALIRNDVSGLTDLT